MILLANGCSWTYGGGLDIDITREELDQITWPKHLSDLLQANSFVNLSDGCGSNQRIFRTTLDYLLNNQHNEDIVAVIQFTEESRFEYYYPLDINNNYENINERWMKAKAFNLTPEIVDRFDKHFSLSQERLTYHNSDIQNVYTYIEHCEALSNLFNKHNIKYYFWDFSDYPNRLPDEYKNYILSNYNWINHKTDGWHWDYETISEEDNHPSATGHKQIADIIYNYIKEDL